MKETRNLHKKNGKGSKIKNFRTSEKGVSPLAKEHHNNQYESGKI